MKAASTSGWLSDLHLRADFAAGLPVGKREFDRNSPTNRLLHSHVYEVIEKEPRGLISDYVLTPFKLDEVLAWMKAAPVAK